MSTKNIAILSNGAAFTNYEVSGIYNPTAATISATVVGSIDTYQTDAYKPLTGSTTIDIVAGYTLYGKFTSVSGNGLVVIY